MNHYFRNQFYEKNDFITFSCSQCTMSEQSTNMFQTIIVLPLKKKLSIDQIHSYDKFLI